MAKQFIVQIGYRHYAVPTQDAPTLLLMLEGLQEVEQKDWRGPYRIKPDGEPVVSEMRLAEVQPPEPPAPPEPEPEPLAITHQPLAIGSEG